VVVVDNCSPDGSADVARDAGAEIVAAPTNRGFGAGCNIGVAATDAPFVLLLNPDARVLTGTISGMRVALAGAPRAAMVASDVVRPDGRAEPIRRRFPSIARAPLEPGLAGRLDARWYRKRAPRGGAVEWVSGACVLVRRAAFEAAGGFDERYFLYSEETDLCARVRQLGWEVLWVPGLPTVHASGGSASATAGGGKVAWVDGFLRFTASHHPHPRLIRVALALGLAARAVAWRVAGRRDAAARWRLALQEARRR
jgi:GT2 family glycosyltransferase